MTDDLSTMRAKLLRQQYYALFMEPPEPLADPVATFGAELRAHLEFLSDLEARGILFCSGPFRDEAGNWIGDGMAIIRAASLEEAQAIAAREPLAVAGIRRNHVRAWQLNEGNIGITLRLMDGSFDVA